MGHQPPRFGSLRRVWVLLAVLAALYVFAGVTEEHYPRDQWLFWRYAGYWLGALVLGVSWLSTGHLALRLCRVRLRASEHLVVAFALGVFAFELVMFGLGAVGGYGTAAFYCMPLVLIAVGIVPLVRYLRAFRRHWKARRARRVASWIEWGVAALGLVGLGTLYYVALTPYNVQYDSVWKHMALAEDFVVHGGIRRFGEGWTFATRPHFTSFLYAWAFQLPGGKLFDRMLLAAHLELLIFLFTTVVAIPVLVRRLVPGAPWAVWAARFAFPGVLIYDASPSGGADHVGAMYCVPILLMLFVAWRRLELGAVAVFGALLSGAALVKYTIALMLVPVPAAAIALRVAWLAVRRRNARALLVPPVAAATCLVLTAPHWLKNWVLYGNPVYPLASKYFSPRPWFDGAEYVIKYGYTEYYMWRPERSWDGVVETLKVLWTWSFEPNDWARLHGDRPVIGSLFTLLLLVLPFLRGAKRVWVVVIWCHVAIFAWYWVHHQERYLQGLMPLLAAATAGMLLLAWRSGGKLVRTALSGLVAFQIVWAGDVFFIANHGMYREPPVAKVASLLEQGHRGRYDQRFEVQRAYENIGERVPEGARVLLHETQNHLGINRTSVQDWPAFQFGLNYGGAENPAEIHETLRRIGVTHIAWIDKRSRGYDTVAGDLMFFHYAHRYGVGRTKKRGRFIASLPKQPPSEPFNDLVVVKTCNRRSYRPGLYRLRDLRVRPYGPAARDYPKPREPMTRNNEDALFARAGFAAVELRCAQLPVSQAAAFELVATRGRPARMRGPRLQLYLRRGR